MGKPVVKVITGMRRVGKSAIVKLLISRLEAEGVASKRIVSIDKESYAFDSIKTYHDLAAYVEAARKQLGDGEMCHVFIDEIQQIEGWERIVSAWSGETNIDVVITGSNASLLSGELATLLSGRHVAFCVYPLSFAEFREFRQTQDSMDEAFMAYLKYGGLPGIHQLAALSEESFNGYVNGIYSTIVLRDIAWRHQIRNMPLLDRIVRFVMDNIGNITNANRINAYLKSQKLSVGVDTVINYIQWLADAHFTEHADIYDIKGKRHLDISGKYYLADLGIRNAIFGYRAGDIGGMLENIVYLELLRRGCRVSIGRIGDLEIDFIAERNGRKEYYQVSYMPSAPATLKRECAPLLSVQDGYPKHLLSMDRFLGVDYNGIACHYLPEWLSR